ncbi:hypothetical protein BST61_g6051 [Cercospora zeina]
MLPAIQIFFAAIAAHYPPILPFIDPYILPLAHLIIGSYLSSLITQGTLLLLRKLLPADQEYVRPTKWGASKENAEYLEFHVETASRWVYWVYGVSTVGQWLVGVWMLGGEDAGGKAWNEAVWSSVVLLVVYCLAILAPAVFWWAVAVRTVRSGDDDRAAGGEDVGTDTETDTEDYEMIGLEEGSVDVGEVRRRIVGQMLEAGGGEVKKWETATGFFR